MIAIVGANGSMGKRYQAILNYLDKPFRCIDVDTPLEEAKGVCQFATGVIVATPTETHLAILKLLGKQHVPILCEKPISKSVAEVTEILNFAKDSKIPFRMTYQYEMLDGSGRSGNSYYNYFRHGSDGLVWDCMQIISLARGDVKLEETSPVWTCRLNGKSLNLSLMDRAYIQYIEKWFEEPSQDLGLLLDAHLKTEEFEKKWKLQTSS